MFKAPKTKDFVKVVDVFEGKTSLFVLAEENANAVLSGRNVPNTKMS